MLCLLDTLECLSRLLCLCREGVTHQRPRRPCPQGFRQRPPLLLNCRRCHPSGLKPGKQPWCSLNLWGRSSSVLKNNTCSQVAALWSSPVGLTAFLSVILSPPVHTGRASAGAGVQGSHPSLFLYQMVVWPHPYCSFQSMPPHIFPIWIGWELSRSSSSDSLLLNKITSSVHLSHFTVNKPRYSCKTFLKISLANYPFHWFLLSSTKH